MINSEIKKQLGDKITSNKSIISGLHSACVAKRKIKTALCFLCFSLLIILPTFLTHPKDSRSLTGPFLHKNDSPEMIQKFSEPVTNYKPLSLYTILGTHLRDLCQSVFLQRNSQLLQSQHETVHKSVKLEKRVTMIGTGSIPNATTSSSVTTTIAESTVVYKSATSLSSQPTAKESQPLTESTSYVVKTTQLTETLTSKQTINQTIIASFTSTLTTEPSISAGDPFVPGSSRITNSPAEIGSSTSTEILATPGFPTNSAVSNVQSTSATKGPSLASPNVSAISRQTIYITTLPDGAVSTQTRITVISEDPETISSTTGTKTREIPSLQTNYAIHMRRLGAQELFGMLGSIVLAAGIL